MTHKAHAGEGVQTRHVALLPNDDPNWVIRDVPSLDSVLYSSSSCTDEIIDQLVQLADTGSSRPTKTLRMLGEGCFGRVYGDGSVAYKVFDYSGRSASIGSFAANAGIDYGLSKIPLLDRTWPKNTEVRGAQMVASIIPNNYANFTTAVWAMGEVKGESDHSSIEEMLPDFSTQRELFRHAILLSGLNPNAVNYDIHPGNYLYNEGAGVVTKIDVMYNDAYNIS